MSSRPSGRRTLSLLGGFGLLLAVACSGPLLRKKGAPPPPSPALSSTIRQAQLEGCAEPEAFSPGPPLPAGSLAQAYQVHFPVGAALSSTHLKNETASQLTRSHFNHFTAENAMKPESLQPREGQFDWKEADRLANFARSLGRKITFHTLVWHRQTPGWFFSGLRPGDPASQEKLKERLRLHIEAVVHRYADVVSNWDVVNEAVEPHGDRTDSPWYKYFGSNEYVYWAFHYTREALEAQQKCSSLGKLYYNDFNINLKVEQVLALLQELEQRGVRIDGVGDQGHYRIDWPSVGELRSTYQKIVSAGYKLKISELDLNVYNDYPPPHYTFQAAPAVGFSPALDEQLARRYAELFRLFQEFDGHISSVTFWGLNDNWSWLNYEPVARPNYPLLWDAQFQPKRALQILLGGG